MPWDIFTILLSKYQPKNTHTLIDTSFIWVLTKDIVTQILILLLNVLTKLKLFLVIDN